MFFLQFSIHADDLIWSQQSCSSESINVLCTEMAAIKPFTDGRLWESQSWHPRMEDLAKVGIMISAHDWMDKRRNFFFKSQSSLSKVDQWTRTRRDFSLYCLRGLLHVKEMASRMNFSATKGDLKIKLYRLEDTILQMWLNNKWRDGSTSFCIRIVFKSQEKSLPQNYCS